MIVGKRILQKFLQAFDAAKRQSFMQYGLYVGVSNGFAALYASSLSEGVWPKL